MFRALAYASVGTSLLWSVIRRYPTSLPFKIVTRSLWYPTMMLTRFNYDDINDYVILGSIPRDFNDIALLKREGVTKIISLNEEWELAEVCDPKYAGIKRYEFPTPDFNPPEEFTIVSAVDALEEHISPGERKSKIYVHCKAGKGRSAIVVICHLMKINNWSCEYAIDYVKQQRDTISLNTTQTDAIYKYKENLEKHKIRNHHGEI